MSSSIESPRRPRPRIWLLAAALLVCLSYLVAEAYVLSFDLGFPLDDSWIHLQFARNLAAGQGLSYNAGALVTGSTSPLWTALLALLYLLPGSVIAWTKLLGIALHLAAVDATFRLARQLGLGRGLAALAAGLTLGTGWLAWSALSGMEVPLFILLALQGIILHLREREALRQGEERPPLALGLLAVAALARPEGLALLALAAVDRLLVFERGDEEGLRWRRPAWRPLLTGFGLAACALIGPVLFYRWAGGSFLPTTFAAKGGAMRHALPDLGYVYVVFGILFRQQPYMTLLAGAGVLALVERLGTPRDRGLLPALFPLAVPLAYSLVSPPGGAVLVGNFGRYYFPFFPLIVLLGVLGLERAAAALGPRLRAGRLRLPLGALLVALLAWPTVSSLVQGVGRYVQNVTNVQDSDVRMAHWLAPRLPPEAVLAVNDIGAIKFFLPNRVIDLAGIANPEIRRALNRGTAADVPWEETMLGEIASRKPDYLIIFPAWFPHLSEDPRFRPLHAVAIKDNITMGAAEVVLYATPWTRYPLRGEEAESHRMPPP
jgi:arabinofuranosyltransferase